MSRLKDVFERHSTKHFYNNHQDKVRETEERYMRYDQFEAAVRDLMPSDEEIETFIKKQRGDMWELMTAYGGMEVADMMMKRMSDYYRTKNIKEI